MISAISPGRNGAFGAGLLNGWTQADGRPAFTVVSGVSTGALMAPDPGGRPNGGSMGFDTGHMRGIYAHGYVRAQSGSIWSTSLPGVPARAAQVATAVDQADRR
jgi:hypothetical protein